MDYNATSLMEEELFEKINIHVSKGTLPIRIDKFLDTHLANTSRSRIQHAIKASWVLVNNHTVKSNYKVRPHDELLLHIPKLADKEVVQPESISLDILFEDESFLIVNKPAGMVVHPGFGNYTGTLLNGIAYHLSSQIGEQALSLERFGLVHRIDKETSGILVVAKSTDAASKLGKQFFNHTVDRTYFGLVWGDVEQDTGTINAHIGRHHHHRIKFDAYPDGEKGKPAITHYKVVERFGFTTLVCFTLETGRTHQIRVHMAHIGHPIFMDKLYGGDTIKKGVVFSKYKQFVDNAFALCPRHLLHAKSLQFVHPLTGKKVAYTSPIPQDMQNVIDKWKDYGEVLQNN